MARERRKDSLPPNPGQRRVLERAESDCYFSSAAPRCGNRESWRKKECTPFRENEGPKGTPRVNKPARALIKGRLGNPQDRSQSSSPQDSLAQRLPHLVQDPRWWRVWATRPQPFHQHLMLKNIIPSTPHVLFQAKERFPSTFPEPQRLRASTVLMKWKLFGQFQQSEALPTEDCRSPQ